MKVGDKVYITWDMNHEHELIEFTNRGARIRMKSKPTITLDLPLKQLCLK